MEMLGVLVHVAVLVATSGSLTSAQMSELRSEAARLWAPYGVEVAWLDREENCSLLWSIASAADVDVFVRLIVDEGDSPSARDAHVPPALGSVAFVRGVPEHTLHLRQRPVRRMVLETKIGAWPANALPSLLQEQFIGRALGRVVAHELGHILLGAPVHANSGLMRPAFTPLDLVRLDRDHLRLSRSLADRVAARARTRGTAAADEVSSAR